MCRIISDVLITNEKNELERIIDVEFDMSMILKFIDPEKYKLEDLKKVKVVNLITPDGKSINYDIPEGYWDDVVLVKE